MKSRIRFDEMSAAERFVRAWQSSKSPAEAAKKLGVSVASACARASYLRKQGIPLRNYKPRVNLKELARLAKVSA